MSSMPSRLLNCKRPNLSSPSNVPFFSPEGKRSVTSCPTPAARSSQSRRMAPNGSEALILEEVRHAENVRAKADDRAWSTSPLSRPGLTACNVVAGYGVPVGAKATFTPNPITMESGPFG